MVYCGKASLACGSCRQRKTRCDKATPSCGQCIRANRQCSGYRNQLDLIFRCETKAVIGKVKTRARAKPKGESPSQDATSTEPLGANSDDSITTQNFDDRIVDIEQHVPGSELTTHSKLYFEQAGLFPELHLGLCALSPSFEERGRGYFRTNSSTWLRNHDLVDALCMSADEREPLLASITAVGLASYANSVQATELLNRARMDYVKALQLTNAALRSSTEARKDTTLFSVIILSAFELVAGSNEHSLKAWTEHINGASTLIKLRGPNQFRTKAGQRLFVQVASGLMISCIQKTIRIPDHIIELRNSASQFMTTSGWPGWELSGVIFDFANFRAGVRDCEIVGPRIIIEKALDIDRRFLDAFAEVPDLWKYTTMYVDQDDDVIWNRRIDIYNDTWTPQIWDGMRCCRIILHELVRDQLLVASTATEPTFTKDESKDQLEKSFSAMLDMQADILASIPSYLPNALVDRVTPIVEVSRGHLVLWPLYVAGGMDLTTQPIRTWVIGRLRAISTRIGIQQATLLADILERDRGVETWDTEPAPRLEENGTVSDQMPASRNGSLRRDWWAVNRPRTANSELGKESATSVPGIGENSDKPKSRRKQWS